MSDPEDQFDVVVIGGGPGGSTAAGLIARRGHRVLVLERERFPRWQIGESLLPATVHGIGSLLGVREKLAAAGFTRKRGGTFKWGDSPEPWTFDFSVSPKMPGPTSFAYQVERSKFDQILLENSVELGAEVREESRVVSVGRTGGPDSRIDRVEYVDDAGNTHLVSARFVINAGGNSSGLHREIGAKRQPSKFFRNLAVFGYFEGGGRLPEPRSGNIFTVAFEHGWFWYIPLTPELTSVGAVLGQDSAARLRGTDRRQVLTEMIASCPEISAMLADARPCNRAPYDEVRVRRDWSYTSTRFHGDGLVLVGDAACFVDPVFSSGVHLATYGALLAARSVNAVLDGAVEEDRAFEEFETRYRKEYQLFHDFLIGFYDMHQVESSYFWHARTIAHSEAPQVEAFVELVGGVANQEYAEGLTRAGEMSVELAAMVQRTTSDDHRSGALAGPGIAQVMETGAELQGFAMSEPSPRRRGSARNHENELRVSADSLAWEPAESLNSPSSEIQGAESTVGPLPTDGLDQRDGSSEHRLSEAG